MIFTYLNTLLIYSILFFLIYFIVFVVDDRYLFILRLVLTSFDWKKLCFKTITNKANFIRKNNY